MNHLSKTVLIAGALVVGCAKEQTQQSAKPQAAATAPAAAVAAKPQTAPAPKAEADIDAWQSLFDGKTLAGWKSSEFAGQGEPRVQDGNMVLPEGASLTGVTYTGNVPTMNYEVTLEAQRVSGSDFFCGLTFPVGKSFASLIMGGWGGSVCGISSLDGDDAANNNTTKSIDFRNKKWYHVRLRVTAKKLEAWLDDDQFIDCDTTDRKVDTRIDIDNCRPFGLASYQTVAAIRNIKVRSLRAEELNQP